MPAVTVEDILVLPRVAEPDRGTAAERSVRTVTTAPKGYEGEGFPVRRAFAGVDLKQLDPFIHMDQMGEVEYAPGEPKGTPWHPHRGFETVTYMIDGIFRHQDSNGGGGLITNGDTQWMTAGGGILHIEEPPEEVVMTGRPLPRLPALGQPARSAEDDHARATRTSGPGRSSCSARRTAARCSGSSRASVGGHEGPGVTHTPITMRARHRLPPARRCGCRGGRTSTRWSTCWPDRARWATAAGRSARASWPCSGPVTCSPSARTSTRRARPGSSTCCCSAASRSASRWRPTGRS